VRAALVTVMLLGLACAAAPSAPATVEIPFGQATLVTAGVAPQPYPPTEWRGFGFQLSETGFVYHGSTATLTVTRMR